MSQKCVFFCCVFFTTAFFFTPRISTAKNIPEAVAIQDISSDSLDAKIAALNARTDLAEPTKNKILSFYRTAQDNLRSEQGFAALAVSYQTATWQANEQLNLQQAKIAKLQTEQLAEKNSESFASLSIEDLENKLAAERTRLNDWDLELIKQSNELAKQENRPQEMRQETDVAKQALEDAAKESENLNSAVSSELEREAKQLQLKTLTSRLTSELKTLGIEAISYPARLQLLKANLQLLSLQKQTLQPVISEMEKALAEKHQQEVQTIQAELIKAEKNSFDKHKVIQWVTKDNISYSLELQAITAKSEHNNLIKARLEEKTVEIENDLKSAERKISLAELSPALGKILRGQRRNLDNPELFAKLGNDIQTETAQASLAEFKVEERLKQLTDVDALLQKMMQQHVSKRISAERRQLIETELHSLLNNQKDLLDKLSRAYGLYLRFLGDYDFAKQQLRKQTDKYALFLDERLLWVPSSAPLSLDYFAQLYQASIWLLNWSNWRGVMSDLLQTISRYLLLTLPAGLVLFGLFFYQTRAKQQISTLAEKIGQFYADYFRFTPQALVYALLIELPAPLAIFYLGWCLSVDNATVFSAAVGKGAQAAAVPWFFLQFFLRLFKADGIVKTHFNWQDRHISLVYQQLYWLRFVAIPAPFLISMTGAVKNSLYSDSLGRLALMLSLLAISWTLARLFHLKTGLLQERITQQPTSWLAKSRYVWYLLMVSAPLIILGFAAAGYYLSALELQQKLVITLRLIFILVVIHQLVWRWLNLVDRELALKNTQQKGATPDDTAVKTEEVVLDIPKINEQTMTLLKVAIGITLLIGFWMIWGTILPAFSFLDQVVLWQYKESVDNQEILQAVTLTNLALAGLYLFVLLIAVTNFSGLIEVLILHRFSIDAGGHYAINQLSKYALVAIGCISIANELGGSWSQVQWLVAALSVGLGFGLQEVFANLVSGVILLFERPIRIGDTVTIDNVNGTVCKIKMRATYIVDWDKKEVVIPNKTFITSQLTNWSLSDQMVRVVISVSVAYGSDIELAYRVICETVATTPLVLAEPKPTVYLMAFAESSLDFSVRAYVGKLEQRFEATHNLHTRLYQALAEHQIEIPFPQRDIHIRSKPSA